MMGESKFHILFSNDKNWVVVALSTLGIYSLYVLGDSNQLAAKEIISNIVAGLLGIAVGKGLKE